MANDNFRKTTVWITVVAMFTAINVVLSMSIFSIPVPGGHLYANDIIICLASLILDPFGAFIVGGVGSFLGDFFFYPAPMFVSLVTRGLQAVIISLISNNLFKNKSKKLQIFSSCLALFIGAIIMVVGYSIGRAFIYSTVEYAILKLPYQIAQAVIGAILGFILCEPLGIKKAFEKIKKRHK